MKSALITGGARSGKSHFDQELAMKAGGALMKGGFIQDAMGAYAVGAGFLMKPLHDVLVRASVALSNVFIDIFDVTTFKVFTKELQTLKEGVALAGEKIVETSTNALDTALGAVLTTAEAKTGKSMEGLVKSIWDAEVNIGYLSAAIEEGLQAPFRKFDTWIDETWGPDYLKRMEEIYNKALNRKLIPSGGATSTASGGSSGAAGGVNPTGALGEEVVIPVKIVDISPMPDIPYGTKGDNEAGLKSVKDVLDGLI